MVHKIPSDFRYARSLGITGTIDNVTLSPPSRKSPYKHWKNHYLNFYIYGKAAWNPDLDVDATAADFLRHYYGPAAGPMKKFWAAMEETTLKFGLHPDFMPEDDALTTPPAIHEWMWNIRYVVPNRRVYELLSKFLDRAEERISFFQGNIQSEDSKNAAYMERIAFLQNWLALWETTKTEERWSY